MAEKVKKCKNCIYRLTRDKGRYNLIGNIRVYKCTLRDKYKALEDTCNDWSNVNVENFQIELNFEGR